MLQIKKSTPKEQYTMENKCELILEREATLKEKLYFQNISGWFFVSFFLLSFICFLILLDFYSASFSLALLSLATIVLYFKLNKDVNNVGKESKKVKKFKGQVAYFYQARTQHDLAGPMFKFLIVENEKYDISDIFVLPKEKTDMIVEIYDNKEIITLNEQKPLESLDLKVLKNSKYYHKPIAITFFITAILSFTLFYDNTYTTVSLKNLILDKKEIEYINANSLRTNPPQNGQRLDISGYRLCEVGGCQKFLLLDKHFEYKFNDDLKTLFDFDKQNNFFTRFNNNDYNTRYNKYLYLTRYKVKFENINEYLQILEKLKKYKFDSAQLNFRNEYIENKIDEHISFIKNLCSAQKIHCTQNNFVDVIYTKNSHKYLIENREIIFRYILDNEREKIIAQINNYFEVSTSVVKVNYLPNSTYEKNTNLYTQSYDELIEQYNNYITRAYSLKVLVYNYQTQTLNGNKNYYIKVIENLTDEQIRDYQLLFLYLLILVLLSSTHFYLYLRAKKNI